MRSRCVHAVDELGLGDRTVAVTAALAHGLLALDR
jgi:hypothetical protein